MNMENDMTDTAQAPRTKPAARRLLPAPGRAALSILRRLGSWYDRWQQRQNLAELDDHILRDIGISPREVERECAKPFWRR